ncbi:MAG: SIMPL domain-containing protein [Chloroflexota bacterium]
MKRYRVMALVLVVVLAVAGISGCAAAVRSDNGSVGGLPADLRVDLNSEQKGIWVSGVGKVTVTPDMALVSLGISAQAAGVADAQSQAASAMEKVMSALAGNGVDKKDIRTQQFSIEQVTRWDENSQQQVVLGYRVNNMVTVKIREIDTAGTIIDAVIAAGGDLTRINGISFTVDDPAPYYTEARDKAMADALAKAEQLAGLAEVKLGKPVYISESTPYAPAVPAPIIRSEAATLGGTSISAGEMEISLNVQVNYAILS